MPPAVAPPPGNPRYPMIDGLRALSATAVVVSHCALQTGAVGTGPLELALLRLGQFAVAMFFAISGFLLYRPFVAAQLEGRRGPRMAVYARRRVLRILPGYWFALTVLAIVPGLPGLYASGWWHYYGFAQLYSMRWVSGGLNQTWTLCVEVAFYALLPLVVVGIGAVIARVKHDASAAWALAIIGGLGLLGIALTTVGSLEDVYVVPKLAPSFLWWFGAGMALAVLSARVPRRLEHVVGAVRAHPGACWAVAAVPFGLAIVLGPLGPVGTLVQQLLWNYVLAPLATIPLLATAVFAARAGLPRRVLSLRPLASIALVSYGIFLWHIGVIYGLDDLGVNRWLHGNAFVPYTLIAYAITLACAAVSYYAVERPFYALKDRRLPFRGPGRAATPTPR